MSNNLILQILKNRSIKFLRRYRVLHIQIILITLFLNLWNTEFITRDIAPELVKFGKKLKRVL